jgi:KDO2-lipid IV(A) lauroyltransferase
MQFRLAKEGYVVNSIIRHMRDKLADDYFLEKRDKVGVKTIYSEPRKACILESMRSLRNNEVLFILLDQNFGTGGVFVNFFGRKAATATGPIILSQKTGAKILPMFIVHNKNGKNILFIEPEFKLEERADKDETILLNIQRLTDIIEQYIRRYPAEWSWIHKRWKTRPKTDG